MLRGFAPFMLLLIIAPAFGAEIECPLKDPENSDYRLVGTYHRIGGCDCGEFAEETKRGDHWQRTDHLEKQQERHGRLFCNYAGPNGRGRDIVMDIPGLVVRCDTLGYDVLKSPTVEPNTGGPTESVIFRAWCTSKP